MKALKFSLLSVLLISTKSFAIDCDLSYGDLPCECCSENWGGGAPPNLAYIIFQGIERTACDPNWVMLPPPNGRLFLLRRAGTIQGNNCAWSYNLDGESGGAESHIWVIWFDLTAYWSFNVYLANKVDDPPADMVYFYRRGLTDCRTVYTNELQKSSCESIFYFWRGGTARIFWLSSLDFGDFNGDGIVNFPDFSILTSAPITDQEMRRFAENWLLETR